MVNYMKIIENKIDNLFDELEQSDLYKNYINAKKQLEDNNEIMDLIEEIKKYQKIATNNKDNSVEDKIKELNKKLESYPLYQSYLIIKEELEQELFQIKEVFEKYFHDILKLED